MKFQSAYSDPYRDSDLACADPSLAQQQFKEDADLNVMLERFKITGQMPQGLKMPSYGDFTHVGDYRSALDAVREARDQFMALPAKTRAYFENDPQKLIEFLADDKNRDEAQRLGLLDVSRGIGGVAPDVGAAAGTAAAKPV
ncbi:MAG: internal scaffolding protein [Microvirus sp.]|nr:MAG: internal scaffolding protein [Microvirus sp.]